MAPNASAKIASETAITRLRIRAMRAARARSFALASSLGDRPDAAERSELGVGVGSCMSAKVGARCESGPGRARGLPGDASTLDQDSGRSRAAPGRGADHLHVAEAGSSSASGLYDCAGKADALASAA